MNEARNAVASLDAVCRCTEGDPRDGDVTYDEYFASMIRAIQDVTMVAVSGARAMAACQAVPANDDACAGSGTLRRVLR